MFSGSFGARGIVLCKCSGKYIDIYFKLKITCLLFFVVLSELYAKVSCFAYFISLFYRFKKFLN